MRHKNRSLRPNRAEWSKLAGRIRVRASTISNSQSISVDCRGAKTFELCGKCWKTSCQTVLFHLFCWNMHKTGFEKLGGIPGVKCGEPETKWNFLHHFASCTAGLPHFDEHKPSDFFFLSPVMEMRAASWREKKLFSTELLFDAWQFGLS